MARNLKDAGFLREAEGHGSDGAAQDNLYVVFTGLGLEALFHVATAGR
ncbi:hypothetical protein [Desulfovibrio sp.]|nr:hypothetical protein [Desulfovibrio sp.]